MNKQYLYSIKHSYLMQEIKCICDTDSETIVVNAQQHIISLSIFRIIISLSNFHKVSTFNQNMFYSKVTTTSHMPTGYIFPIHSVGVGKAGICSMPDCGTTLGIDKQLKGRLSIRVQTIATNLYRCGKSSQILVDACITEITSQFIQHFHLEASV